MKRFLTILLTALALTGLLCVGASASSFDGAAAELSAIGMLKGTAGGFDLDKAPTRAQAAIMLVRLFGAEDEAKAAFAAGELKCPFTDVGETAAPYVAWLKAKGLTSGTTETTFGGSSPCTAKAYTIFLLRALGYQDNTDFTTANAKEFAMGLGLLDTSMFTGKFLRDDLAALTYQALGTNLKDGSTYLLDSLVKSGAIDAAAAKPITDKIETYRALEAASLAMDNCMDADINAKLTMSVSASGVDGGKNVNMSENEEASVAGNVKVIMGDGLQMACDMTVQMDGETEKVEYWMKDGVTYARSGDMSYQMPAAGMEALQELLEQEAGQSSGAALLPFIEKIEAKSAGGGTVYTLTLNDAFAGMVKGILQMFLQAMPAEVTMDMDMSLDGSTISYTMDKDGSLKSAAVDMTLGVSLAADAGAEGSMDMSISMDMDMTMDVKAAGKDVKITFPDFSGFENIPSASVGVIGGADGPTAIYTTVAA